MSDNPPNYVYEKVEDSISKRNFDMRKAILLWEYQSQNYFDVVATKEDKRLYK